MPVNIFFLFFVYIHSSCSICARNLKGREKVTLQFVFINREIRVLSSLIWLLSMQPRSLCKVFGGAVFQGPAVRSRVRQAPHTALTAQCILMDYMISLLLWSDEHFMKIETCPLYVHFAEIYAFLLYSLAVHLPCQVPRVRLDSPQFSFICDSSILCVIL